MYQAYISMKIRFLVRQFNNLNGFIRELIAKNKKPLSYKKAALKYL